MTYQDIIKRGLELGLEAVEVYANQSESNTLKLNDGKLESYNVKELFGVSIRGLYQGKMGYVYTETLEDKAIEELLKSLVDNVKMIDTTEPEFMFEEKAMYKSVPVVQSDYKNYSTIEKINMLKKLEKDTLSTSEKITKIGYCQYSETSSSIKIINSYGLDLSKSSSYISAFVGAIATDGDQTFLGISGDVNVNFKNLEVDRMVKEASENALAQIGAGFVKSNSYPVVLKRDVATEILSAFSSVFSGDAAVKKMTILKDKKGKKVFGDNITIIDDPFYHDALIQTSFDDEGVPCQIKEVVKDGIFNGLLHNLKTAKFCNEKPTGNGFKASTAGSVSVSPTNLFIKEGTKTKEEIITTVEDGIYVCEVSGLHAGLNPISGDFNVQASGFEIKNGKIVRPITLFVVSGNFYEMMNNIEEIGNDIEKRFIGVASPTLKVKSLAISGK